VSENVGMSVLRKDTNRAARPVWIDFHCRKEKIQTYPP
jgi:hypothetical protein